MIPDSFGSLVVLQYLLNKRGQIIGLSKAEIFILPYDKIIKMATIGNIYVQRKVRIGTIPELYLRILRIPTLAADFRIVPDNSRIAQGVFYRFSL